MPLERITGEAISQVLLKFLNENNIPTCNICGQGYDGASNMPSDAVGVQHGLRDSGFFKVFDCAVRIADKVGTTVVMP